MSETEQLDDSDFGIRGIEKAAGLTKMPLADAPPQEEQLAPDAAKEVFIATRDEAAPLVERTFYDVETGEKRPETETVSAEDAARNLANTRAAEQQALADQHRRDLAEALDELHGQQPVADDSGSYAHEQVPGRTEPQPDYGSQADAYQPEAVQATDPRIDPAIAAALEIPAVRNLLQQANQEIEQQKAAFIEATNSAAAEVTAAMLVSFPEFSHVRNAGELAAAATVLAQQNPQRFQQFRDFYSRTQTVLQRQQQVSAHQQQQQQELGAAQFKQFALSADDAFDRLNAHVPQETMRSIKAEAVSMLKEYGLSDQDLAREYNSNPLLRSAAGQQILADAARFRLSQKGLSRRLANPVPNVQRPGSPEAFQTRTEEALASARAKLKPSMSAKQAAEYLIAKRGATR